MNIGIAIAMKEEADGMLSSFEFKTKNSIAGKELLEAKVGERQLSLCVSGVGKVNSAIATSLLAQSNNLDVLASFGLAGSASEKVSVNDLVLMTEGIQHDVDATPNFSRFQIPFEERLSFCSDPKITRALLDKCQSSLKGRQLHHGLIATGDCFISDSEALLALKGEVESTFDQELLAVDMESAAIAQVAASFGIPFVSMRVISDAPLQSDSVASYHAFKHELAAQACLECLELLL